MSSEDDKPTTINFQWAYEVNPSDSGFNQRTDKINNYHDYDDD